MRGVKKGHQVIDEREKEKNEAASSCCRLNPYTSLTKVRVGFRISLISGDGRHELACFGSSAVGREALSDSKLGPSCRFAFASF